MSVRCRKSAHRVINFLWECQWRVVDRRSRRRYNRRYSFAYIARNLSRNKKVKSRMAIPKKVSIFVTRFVDNKILRLASVSHFVWHVVLCHFSLLLTVRLFVSFHFLFVHLFKVDRSHSFSRVCLMNEVWRLIRETWRCISLADFRATSR